MGENTTPRRMAVRRQTTISTLRSSKSSLIKLIIPTGFISILLITLNQVFGVSPQIILLVVAASTTLVIGRLWHKGIFISLWSLRLKTLHRKYESFGALALLTVLKSRRRRTIELLKGLSLILATLLIGTGFAFLHSTYQEQIPFELSVPGSVLGTTWQVHAVIIGFSFVALTFAWEEIHSNPLKDELTRLFVEDIGSIWIVTFVFGANLAIGFTVFTQPSSEPASYLAIYTTGVLFTVSIVFVARRFLAALDLLFYTDLDEKVKTFAKQDLEKDIIRTSSPPNQVLAESVPGFNPLSMRLPDFGLDQITITSRDIDKIGTVTDINLRRMNKIAEIIGEETAASIDQNPTVDMTLAEDSTVLTIDGNISEDKLDQIQTHLRRGLKTRSGN
jgi:hypothetical protein